MSILQPKALRFWGARSFQQHGKLQRLSVLCFVEDNAKVFFANSLPSDGVLQQLFGECDLIPISHESAIESKVEIVTLHLFCHACGCVADPAAERRKFLMPELSKPGVCCRETNRPLQIFPIAAEALFPFA